MLSEDCEYSIGQDIIYGPKDIAQSYERNMIEGKKKLDQLEWGQSEVESISDYEFLVHFTDYLMHKGKKYVHRCQQKVTVDSDLKITKIEHIADLEEQKRLDAFYRSVGLKK